MWRVFLRMALVCAGLWAGWQAGAWVNAQPADAQYPDAPREQVADTSLSVTAEHPDTSTDADPSFPLVRRPDRFLMWGAGAVLMIMLIAAMSVRRRRA